MSEATMEPVEVNEQPQKIQKEGLFLEERSLGADAEGFTFYIVQYTDVKTLQAKLGDEGILALVNSKLNFDLRTKAKNRLPDPEGASKEQKLAEWQKLRDEGKTLLITPDEAEAHRPGEREMSSPESMLKEAKKLLKEASGDKVDPARAHQLKAEAKALKQKALAIISSSISED